MNNALSPKTLYTFFVIYLSDRNDKFVRQGEKLGAIMAKESERVTVRIPVDKLEALQILIDKGQYTNISDVVRAAIDEFVETHITPEHITRMTVELPKGNVVKLEELVHDGDAISVDDAVRNAVRDYVRMKLRRTIEQDSQEP